MFARFYFCLAVLAPLAGASPGLVEQFAEIAHSADGKVGVSMKVIETGVHADFHGSQHFPMQSVYKFPIAMAALHLVDEGRLTLEQQIPILKSELAPPGLHSPIRDQHPQGTSLNVRELVRYAVSESDGTASDALLHLAGGAATVTRYLHDLGIKGVVVATTEMEMASGPMVQYSNWASPNAMIELLEIFHAGRGLSHESHALLEGFMARSTPGAKRIKGMLPPGTHVAHKTGTSATKGKLTRATNDVGIVTLPNGHHLAIAVFVANSKAAQDVREATIARISKAAWDAAK